MFFIGLFLTGATKSRLGLVILKNFKVSNRENFQKTNERCLMNAHLDYFFENFYHKLSNFNVKNVINCQIIILYLDLVVRIKLIIDLTCFSFISITFIGIH